MKPLLPEEREFFGLVADIAFVNPFGHERREAETRVTKWLGGTSLPRDRLLFEAIVPALSERLAAVDRRGIGRLKQVAKDDRRLLRHMWLFELYHRHLPPFNRHIEAQLTAGEQPLPFAAAATILKALAERGMGADEALRYLALFFQLRRAFWFIDIALVGESPCMEQLRQALWDCVFTSDVRAYEDFLWDRMEDFSTLLIGATGTGKGTAAAAIGRSGLIPFDAAGGRFRYSFTATFTATNLSEYPESLIESELFGHRKGAFTGAVDNHEGLFARCNPHGALLLDEIGDVSVPVQLKLLRVLQERSFTPVGSRREQRFDGRVIAATNQPLDELMASGRFRADFYYRLCSTVIEVPTLRQRLRESPGELERMVTLLLERLTGSASSCAAVQLAERVSRSLRDSLPADYAWPGNVRELEQAVRRILLGSPYRGLPGAAVDGNAVAAAIDAGELTAEELMALYCHRLHQQLGSYEAVARKVALDRRTVKKYVELAG